MKTKFSSSLLLSVLCLSINLSANGQNKPRVGIVGGINASQIKTSTNLTNLLLRYNVGLAYEQQFSDKFALAGNFIYSKQGSSLKQATLGNGIKDKYITNFNYLALPVLLRFRPKGERTFIEAGGQIGYLIYNKSYNTSDKEKTTESFTHTRKVDAGMVGGVGYRLGKNVVIDARYYYGLKPLRKSFTAPDPQTGASVFYRTDRWYNRVWSLNFTYYF